MGEDFERSLPWCSFRCLESIISNICSVQFIHSVVCLTLCYPSGLQHTRPPCPPPALVNDAIQHLIVCDPLLLLPSTLPASVSFWMSQFFTWDAQNIRASASASVLPMNIKDWFLLRLTALISLMSKGLSRVFSNTTVQKHQFFGAEPSLWSNSHIHTWLLEKPWLCLSAN